MARDKNETCIFNNAGPGALVGIQCQNLTIGGSLRINGNDITIDDDADESDS